MKYIILVMFGFLSITWVRGADVSSGRGYYVQPAAFYVAAGGDYKGGWGGALSAGFAFNQHHAVEVELMTFKVETEEHFNAGYSYKTDLKQTPLLLTYRYTFALGKRFDLFGGVSAGTTFEESERTTRYYNSNPNLPVSGTYTYSDSVHPFMFGAQAGLTYELTPRMTGVLALKILQTSGGSERSTGYATLHLGFGYKF
jgi:hypothetical protein